MQQHQITRQLCLNGLLIALVCVATMVIQIPVAGTEGYIHPGDSIIFLAAIFFGKKEGAIAGGIGSALADILSGYAHWALFTLIIKGIMGYMVGAISDYNKEHKLATVRSLAAPLVGAVIMVVGYLIGGAILKGSFLVSLASVPSNLLQGVGGMVIYGLLATCLHKAKFYKLIQTI